MQKHFLVCVYDIVFKLGYSNSIVMCSDKCNSNQNCHVMLCNIGGLSLEWS